MWAPALAAGLVLSIPACGGDDPVSTDTQLDPADVSVASADFDFAPSFELALASADAVVVARPSGEVRREEESGLPVAFYTMQRETVLRGDIAPFFEVKLYGGESKELSPSGEPRYILIPGALPSRPRCRS